MAIAHGINRDELAVAITRDGRVYVGKAIPPTKLQKTVIESRFLTRLFRLVGKADHFFFTRLLRLPYFLDSDAEGQGDEASETIWHQAMMASFIFVALILIVGKQIEERAKRRKR